MVKRPPPVWHDPPEHVWVYKDVYEVMRVSIGGPHRTRTSMEYIRRDVVEAILAEAALRPLMTNSFA